MSALIWNPETVPAELIPMLETLGEEYPVASHGRGLKINFEKIKSDKKLSTTAFTF